MLVGGIVFLHIVLANGTRFGTKQHFEALCLWLRVFASYFNIGCPFMEAFWRKELWFFVDCLSKFRRFVVEILSNLCLKQDLRARQRPEGAAGGGASCFRQRFDNKSTKSRRNFDNKSTKNHNSFRQKASMNGHPIHGTFAEATRAGMVYGGWVSCWLTDNGGSRFGYLRVVLDSFLFHFPLPSKIN